MFVVVLPRAFESLEDYVNRTNVINEPVSSVVEQLIHLLQKLKEMGLVCTNLTVCVCVCSSYLSQ